ncbi:MAG: hypothetical protein HGA39_07020 [Coriobacteriia bacterium]|nr:hypothetical protein [Coriobacteriia bacterium]
MDTLRIKREIRKAVHLARADDGMALATVVVISAILFMLVTTLLVVVAQQQLTTSHTVARAKALQVADSGIDAYLYHMRQNTTYYSTNPVLGPVATTEGMFTVTATPPTGNGPIILRSVGTIPSLGATKSIVASVRYPTFADYVFLYDTDISIGSEATIIGKVRSNRSIDNDGVITGACIAADSITGSGSFGSRQPDSPVIDFSSVLTDMGQMKTTAQGTSTYFASSGTRGYRVILNGMNFSVAKVTAVNSSTGALTLGTATNYSIPTAGILYFNDTIWLSGTYSTRVTVACGDTSVNDPGYATPVDDSAVFILDNLVPQDPYGTAVCGVVALGDISVPSWYSSMPQDLTIQAALLSQAGGIHADWSSARNKDSFHLIGSRAQKGEGGFVSGSMGFMSRVYEYDARLDTNPPPSFPVVRDGALKVSTWVEN